VPKNNKTIGAMRSVSFSGGKSFFQLALLEKNQKKPFSIGKKWKRTFSVFFRIFQLEKNGKKRKKTIQNRKS
jgi:hypothetical protein